MLGGCCLLPRPGRMARVPAKGRDREDGAAEGHAAPTLSQRAGGGTEREVESVLHFGRERQAVKGWWAGPWNASIPLAVGYANAGVDEPHYHAEMVEVYLVAQGRSTAVVGEQRIALEAGAVLIVEPGEVHTFLESSSDYYHFVVQAPVVVGDKHLAPSGQR